MADIVFKDNWDETRQRYDAWLHGQKTDRPLMSLRAVRPEDTRMVKSMPELPYDDLKDRYTNVDKHFARSMNRFGVTTFLAESYPQIGAFLGAGSMALYLGSDPVFADDTIWFTESIDDYSGLEFTYDPENKWWKFQLELLKKQAASAAGTDIIVGIPDIVENIDILSAMRGPSQCCYDIYDYPDEVKKALAQLTDLYQIYYDAIYDIVKKPDGSSSYGPYNVYGSGKSAKIQCDFSALISPEHFDEFVMPGLTKQCDGLDNIIFHLDGEECIVHLDSLLSLSRLGAIQWTPPPGPSDIKAANDKWFDLYKKVRKAGKGLWLSLAEYGPEGSIEAADKIIREIGPGGLYFQFPDMDIKLAQSLMLRAERDWKA